MAEVDELARIADVLDGTNSAGPIGAGLAKWDASTAQLTAVVAQLTAAVTQLTALVGQHTTQTGHLNSLAVNSGAANTALGALETAIENVDVTVTVAQADVASAILNTGGPQPLIEKQAIKKSITAAGAGARSPKIPGRL